MRHESTIERVNRLMIMLVRELYIEGNVDTAVAITGMTADTISLIGQAPLSAIEDLIQNLSVSLFIPRFGSGDFLVLMELPNALKSPYALIAKTTHRGN